MGQMPQAAGAMPRTPALPLFGCSTQTLRAQQLPLRNALASSLHFERVERKIEIRFPGGDTMEVRDPVCGMRFAEERAVARAVHGGRTFNFCSWHCRTQFETDPARYMDNEPAAWQTRCAGPYWWHPT